MGNIRFKVGDRVRIKSIDWYNENKTIHGDVWFDNAVFVGGQSLYCGCELTIRLVTNDSYYVIENDYYWTDEMIEGLVEDEIKFNTALNPIEMKSNANCLTQERVDELATKIDKDLPSGNQNVWELPDGYQFVDENGNVIKARKIVLKKKKKEYPKTYEECAKILLDRASVRNDFGYKGELLVVLQKLLVCRDAYWKIAGEERGKDKPWKPNWWDADKNKMVIEVKDNKAYKNGYLFTNRILAFPTEEMRDAFYENFKGLIEECKELL